MHLFNVCIFHLYLNWILKQISTKCYLYIYWQCCNISQPISKSFSLQELILNCSLAPSVATSIFFGIQNPPFCAEILVQGESQTDFWKTHPINDFWNFRAWQWLISGKLIQEIESSILVFQKFWKKYWISFPKIGLAHDPENQNFGKNFGWVIQDLPIKTYFWTEF